VRLDPRSAGDPAIAEAAARILAAAPGVGTEGKPAGAQKGAEIIPADPILDPARTLDVAAETATGADLAVAQYASGSAWRERGELDAAESRYVKALRAATGTPFEGAISGVVDRDRQSIALEKKYLQCALAHFKAALETKLPPHQKALLCFLAAECARRTGDRGDAAKLYQQARAIKDPEPDPQMRSLVQQGLADLPGGSGAGGRR
jgi:tetratricopeptide (TPR) repeat protein